MAQNERKKKKASSGDSMRTILYVVLVVVGIAGAVVLGTSGGSSDTTTDTVVTVPGGVQPAEYQKFHRLVVCWRRCQNLVQILRPERVLQFSRGMTFKDDP